MVRKWDSFALIPNFASDRLIIKDICVERRSEL